MKFTAGLSRLLLSSQFFRKARTEDDVKMLWCHQGITVCLYCQQYRNVRTYRQYKFGSLALDWFDFG